MEYRFHGAVAAFVELTLQSHRYYFLLDTGAAGTFVDAGVARTLHLSDDGPVRRYATLGCTASAQPVKLAGWRLGDRSFGATTVLAEKLLLPRTQLGAVPVGGLLGSDTLSRFGTITIDFARRRMTLAGRPPSGGRTIHVEIKRRRGQVLAAVRATIHDKPVQLVLDTGAAISTIDSRAAARLGLRPIGPQLSVRGATCRARVVPLVIDHWTIDGIRLARALAASAKLPLKFPGKGVVGVIGSNALAGFGKLTIDYVHARVVLGGTDP